jgi:DNA-binding NtrC family response regulator
MYGMIELSGDRVALDGSHAATTALWARLGRAAAELLTHPVFLAGESGSGRRHAARVLHAEAGGGWFASLCGAHADAPKRVADLLSAVPEGPGTLYIDRVHDLPAPARRDLLAALRRGLPPGLRLVTSHPCPRDGGAEAPLPADDLRFHLEAVVVPVPPLRARAADVPAIAAAMLAEFGRAEGRPFDDLSPEVAVILARHDWPGNLRELSNVIRSVVLMHDGPRVTPEMLPPTLAAPRPDTPPAAVPMGDLLHRPLDDIERWVIETVITREDGSIPRAARALGISPSTIYRKIEAWERRASGGAPGG